jgi:membrane protease YdiL (CAAX protease family)
MSDSLTPLIGALLAMSAVWGLWHLAGSNRSRHPDVANPEVDRVRFRMLATVGIIVAIIFGFILFG